MSNNNKENAGGIDFSQVEDFTRRHFFLHLSSLFLMAVSGIAVMFSMFRFLSPVTGGDDNAIVEINEADVKPGEGYFFKYKNKPAVAVVEDNQFYILSAVCTHLGCIVKWKDREKLFECPCHAGQYDLEGKVTSGPPPEPLLLIDYMVVGGKILVGKKNA